MACDWSRLTLKQAGVSLTDCDHRTPSEASIGYPYVTIPQLRDGRIALEDARLISPENFVEWTRKAYPKANDVVLSRRCNPGESAYVPEGVQFALGQNLVLLRADGTRVYPPFLRWAVQGPEWWRQVNTYMNVGAVFTSLKCADIPKFELTIPPIETQQQIAGVLGALDAKIDLNRRINQTLEAMAQAIFKSWFVDFDPVKAKITAKAEGRDPLRAAMTAISGKPDAELDTLPPDQLAPLAATAALFPDEMDGSDLGDIPKGWQATPLDGLAMFLNGLALQKFPPESTTEYLPVIKIAQLRAGHTQGADRASKSVKPEYVVEDGDVLFSWSGSLEVDVWTGGPGALNQHLFKVTSEQYPKWFYLLATKHHLPVFREIAANKATTMGHIQRRHLSEALVAVAPGALMSRATELLGPVVNEIVALRLQSRELAVARDTLLPKLLSGELVVPAPTGVTAAVGGE